MTLREWLVIAALAVLAAVGGSNYAWPKPPPGTDLNSPIHQWYQSLANPNSGIGCCGEDRDCRPVESRTQGDHWQALIATKWPDGAEKRWVDVPDDVILKKKDNPVGRAVACMSPGDWTQYAQQSPIWYCFVLPYMS